ncbi:MAG: maleylpyruvate isomerase family mycothiol-dependent enzyme [Actinobacteria bacterium]|nr:maleylpyruvate isomerase family mycothiol-dependent enzyme [Actinomycetota bacterium]
MSERPNYADAYRGIRERVTALVQDRSDEDLDQRAPATPEWRVRDVLAHYAGVCDDIANGRLEGVGTDDWTDVQVQMRREWPVAKVLADWQEHAEAIAPQMQAFPEIAVGQMLFDAWTHEHDIRGALGEPGSRDSDATDVSFNWITDRLSERISADGKGTVVLETEAGEKQIGAGEPTTRLRADRFEVLRAATGRRSVAQLRAMDWDGPFEPEQLVVSTAIFTPPANDLLE